MTEDRMTEYRIDELIPHSGKMLLLDQVIESGDDWLVSQVNINENSQFVEAGSVPALVVIEYMAQSVAALAGIQGKKMGEAVRIGLLLGTRKFESNVDSIPVGVELTIHVEEVFAEENGLAVYACKATSDEATPNIALACHLNVYHPEDIDQLNIN